MKSLPKVILISYFFPPVRAIGSVRNKNIADEFHQSGYDVHVFTSDPAAGNANYFVEGMIPYDLKYFLSGRSKLSGQKLQSVGWATKLMNTFPLNILTGEGGLFYTLRLVCRLLKYRRLETIVYSSYRPMADHHVGYMFKLLAGRKCTWIADYRDVLYDKDVVDVWWPRIHEWVYKQMTQRANCLTTVSRGIADYLEEYNKQICVVRNGIRDVSTHGEIPFGNDKVIKISYTGALYAGRRDPSILFEALSDLLVLGEVLADQIKLSYAGKESALWNSMIDRYSLASVNNDLGLVSRSQAIELQMSSDINVLLTWSSSNNKGILTGKFYEYINAGNAILCVIKGSRDEEFEEIFEMNRLGEVVYDDKERVKGFIRKILSRNTQKSYIPPETRRTFKFSLGMKELIDALDDV